MTGRDRSRPLRPLSGDADDDPLCKTVCFNAPSPGNGADFVGISSAGDVRGELLALFGRLPNLGGQLLSESFRGGAKMKTAQSAPELKCLLDGSGEGPEQLRPGKGGRGPGPPAVPVVAMPMGFAKGPVTGPKKAPVEAECGDEGDGDNGNGDNGNGDGYGDQQVIIGCKAFAVGMTVLLSHFPVYLHLVLSIVI